jgi:hypothetical protein
MTFRNKRTGNVITVPCRLDGPDWEEVTEAKKAEPVAAPAKAAPKRKAKASD